MEKGFPKQRTKTFKYMEKGINVKKKNFLQTG